ncbi:MAG TPA: tetratricopeptide repeat protein [Candidatus Sulfotelmatobacter sp.]
MEMALRDRTGLRNSAPGLRLASALGLAMLFSSPFQAQTPPGNAPQTPPDAKSSTTSTIHEKTGPDSSRTVRHVRVPEGPSQSPELSQAEELIQKPDYSAAETLLQKYVQRDAANYEAWFDLGFVENALGKVEESISAYRKSVSAKPDVFESNLNLGLQLAKTQQPDAEQFLRAATQLKPTSHVTEGQYRAWLSLGRVLEKSSPAQALAAYGKAADLQGKEAEPHLAAGRLLETEQRYSDAEQEYKKALAVDPASDALTGLANVYMQERHFPEAEESLRKLVSVSPDQSAAHVQLGRILAAEGKNDEAIVELQTGIKNGSREVGVQRDLAEVYVAAGKAEEAESAYSALSQANPQDAELHRAFGQTLLHNKKFPQAQQEFLTTVKLKPNYGEAYGDLAFAASENKDYALTVKALEARAKLLPEIPITYFLRASALDHLKDFKQAAVNYRLFLKMAEGKYPDQEWQAKHRLIAIEPKK